MQVAVELLDGTRTIASARVPVVITGAGQVTVTATLTGLGDITLWDIDHPKLYHVVATLMVDGSRVHDYRVRTGFREAAFCHDGFYLNGRRVKLLGVNRHQFFPFAGGAMPARIQARDAGIIRRELNCNMVRCSHYPQSEAFYDACDELGLMAWEEAPGWGYLGDESWLALAYRDIGEMIVRDRNHPSIIIWGARLNETPNNVPFYTRTNALAHSLDDSRPTGGALAGLRLTTDYEQDVFGEDDYSSVTRAKRIIARRVKKEPTLQPPVDGPASHTWSARRSAPCPGRPSTTGALTARPSSRDRRRHTRGCTTSPPPTTAIAACSRGPGSTTRPAVATSIRA